MGEEVKITDDNDNNRVVEWEDGLPSLDDLTPLSTSLIPPQLASAFRITSEPSKTMADVNRASENTFSSLEKDRVRIHNEEEEEEEEEEADLTDSRKTRRIEEAAAAAAATEDDNNNNNNVFSNKGIKRPRLVWTPQLHKRFVDVVAHLGIKNAVPKTIMQLMNVEGLTRENVASHLQKYRLYLKRMQGLSNEGPSSSDHLFASTPVPQSLQHQGNNGVNSSGNNMAITMPMPMMMMPMPMMGMSGHGFHGHPYNIAQQRDWSGNKFGPYHGDK